MLEFILAIGLSQVSRFVACRMPYRFLMVGKRVQFCVCLVGALGSLSGATMIAYNMFYVYENGKCEENE